MDELEKIREKKMEKLMAKSTDKPKTKVEVTDSDFEKEVIGQSTKTPVVVDFWASWCGPCLAISPLLEKLAEEYKGKFVLAKLNVDESPRTSQKYAIMSIPTIKFFRNAEVVDELIGARPEPEVRQWLDKNLG